MQMKVYCAMEKEIQDKACRLMLEGSNLWIIDLRFNGIAVSIQ